MPSFPTKPVLASLVVFLAATHAQDAAAVVFPTYGNGSSLELGSKPIETSFSTDNHNVAASSFVSSPVLPPNYYIPAFQRMPVPSHHRSDGPPYGFEYPPMHYPVAHQNPDQALGVTTKHLVIVSFIGLLLLLAILQNTIIGAKRKQLSDVLPSRRKREIFTNIITPEAEDIINDDARIRCIQRTLCMENRKLSTDLGVVGKVLAKYLTRNVKASLNSPSGWNRLVEDAGVAGTRGENCDVLYRGCTVPGPGKALLQPSRKVKDGGKRNQTGDPPSIGSANRIDS